MSYDPHGICLPGYGVLGPYARSKGWAPGPIGDWKDGATGWILWVSLAIMLGDSLTSLSLLVVSSVSCGKSVLYPSTPIRVSATLGFFQ